MPTAKSSRSAPPPKVPSSARARARAEITNEIKHVARRQVGEVGAPALSLRAVARELGMVSSAIYRYFPSRDELLTALIIDAYDALGAVVEEAEARVARRNVRSRWLAVGHAVRLWAVEHRHEYALIYGSPVPGYRAPIVTVGPATRVQSVLLAILDDATGLEPAGPAGPRSTIPRSLRADLAAIRLVLANEVDDARLLAGMAAWTELFGAVSFEVFGQFQNVIREPDRYFDLQLRAIADRLGL